MISRPPADPALEMLHLRHHFQSKLPVARRAVDGVSHPVCVWEVACVRSTPDTKDHNGFAPTISAALAGTNLLGALARAPFSIVLADARLEGMPLVYVNETFSTITGYSEEFAIGRNCRFLQGTDTDQPALETLRTALRNEDECVVNVRNYRPDGELFWNRLMISPLRGEDGTLLYYVGLQLELETPPDERMTDHDRNLQRALDEVQHRLKNHLALIVSMIRIQAGAARKPDEDYKTLARRVETLQLLYEELSGQPDIEEGSEDVALGAYLSRVVNAIAHLDGRSGVRVNIDAETLRVPFSTATQLGLILSELTTNSLKHAFDGREEGQLDIE
ncbi:MAG: PAS domain-containing protein, partial [Pseudomonadota bacterium]